MVINLYMSIRNLSQNISCFLTELAASRESETLILASDLKGIVNRRVVSTGKDGQGKGFGKYSKAVVPAHYYRSKGSKSQVDKAVKSYGYLFSYEQWRESTGRQTGFKDFFFTGQLWRNIRPQIVQVKSGEVKILVTASNEEDKVKLENLAKQSGNILTASNEEINFIADAYGERVEDILRKCNVI